MENEVINNLRDHSLDKGPIFSCFYQVWAYSDKLAHVQGVINCRYSVAQLCTREDGLAYILGTPSIDDVTSYNWLKSLNHSGTFKARPSNRPLAVLHLNNQL